MKSIIPLILLLAIITSSFVLGKQFPAVNLKSLDGKSIAVSTEFAKNKLTVVSFWATWCSPCKKELDAINPLYEEWKKMGVDMIAITIDDAQQLAKVKPLVNQKKWGFTILTDQNKDLLSKLNFQTIPQTFIVDKHCNILYSHSGYTPGDEYELEKKLKELLK